MLVFGLAISCCVTAMVFMCDVVIVFLIIIMPLSTYMYVYVCAVVIWIAAAYLCRYMHSLGSGCLAIILLIGLPGSSGISWYSFGRCWCMML